MSGYSLTSSRTRRGWSAAFVAKPGNLSALCDDVSSLSRTSYTHRSVPSAPIRSASLSSPITSGINCVCRQRKRYRFRKWRWGPFEFFNEATLVNGHLPECEISQVLKDDHYRSLGLRYTGIASLTSRAVKMAFSMTTGGGGFSISPNLIYYPVVDRWEAPAFVLLSTLHRAMLSRDSMTKTERQTLTETVGKKIIRLFHERKASPTDVDLDNKSLLHSASYLVCIFPWNSTPISEWSDKSRLGSLTYLVRLLNFQWLCVYSS